MLPTTPIASRQAHGLREYNADAETFVATEIPNLRIGLASSLAAGDATLSARFLYGLWFHWLTAGLGREAEARAREWLKLDPPGNVADYLGGLIAVGEILRGIGDRSKAIELKRVALSVADSHPNVVLFGRPASRWAPPLLSDLASLLIDVGEVVEARGRAEETLRLRREAGQAKGITHALWAVIQIEDTEENFARALELTQEAIALYEQAAVDPREFIAGRMYAAELNVLLGREDAAIATLHTVMSGHQSLLDVGNDATALRVAAHLAVSLGESELALRLIAAVADLAERTGTTVRGRSEVERDERAIVAATETVGLETARRAAEEGRDADAGQLIDEVRIWLDQLECDRLARAEQAPPSVD